MSNSGSRTFKASSHRSLYERDYYTWALEQAHVLEEKRAQDLDWDNLAEEVEDLARRDVDSLRNQLARLLAHLLKWQVQPSRRSNSWRASIRGARDQIRELLDESPGLKSRISELFKRAYRAGLNLAIEETNLNESRFPAACPWTFEQATSEDFWPDSLNRADQRSGNDSRSNRKRH